MRLDKALLELNPSLSRTKAQSLIQEGRVSVNGRVVLKNNQEIEVNATITVNYDTDGYVGRGGLKLAHAIKAFSLDFSHLTVVDIGSSTGGFTDCVLQHGAKKVYAVDVGKDQLAPTLRQDDRVVVMESTHFNDVLGFEERIDAMVMDVSFISMTKLLNKVSELLEPHAFFVALVKPQFEAGSAFVNKAGIVKDRNIHVKVLENIDQQARYAGLYLKELTHSAIQGKSGNIEYVALFQKTPHHKTLAFRHIVNQAFDAFKG